MLSRPAFLPRRPAPLRLRLAQALLAAALLVPGARLQALPAAAPAPLPQDLRGTGWPAAGAMPFNPQYPLWSDGAAKRRWLALPPGKAIDARQPDAWQFPVGTRLWKEFAVDGRPVETRYIERRADGQWLFASYVWNADGSAATLAPAEGVRLAVTGAPGGRYDVPSRDDCRACHDGAAVPVLGVSALQLSPDRDPLAPHARPWAPGEADLRLLAARGWLRHLPPALLMQAPRIASGDPVERAALGYLHGNCGHCHNHNGAPAPVQLRLAQTVGEPALAVQRVRASMQAAPRFRWPGEGAAPLLDAAAAERSLLHRRMVSRDAATQMPPLGTARADADALALIARWIARQPLPPDRHAVALPDGRSPTAATAVLTATQEP